MVVVVVKMIYRKCHTMTTDPRIIRFIVGAAEGSPSFDDLPLEYQRVDQIWRLFLPKYDPDEDDLEDTDPEAFMQEVDASLQNDWVLMRRWVKYNPYVYKYLPEGMRRTEEFIRLITGHLYILHKYVPIKITDANLAQKLCAVDSDTWRIMDDSLSTNPELILAMLKATDDPQGDGETIYQEFGSAKDVFHDAHFRQRLIDDKFYPIATSGHV
jgi:hypothetical protein